MENSLFWSLLNCTGIINQDVCIKRSTRYVAKQKKDTEQYLQHNSICFQSTYLTSLYFFLRIHISYLQMQNIWKEAWKFPGGYL